MPAAQEDVDPLSHEVPVYEVDVPITALLAFAAVVVGTVLVVAGLSRTQQLVGVAIAAAVLAAVIAPVVRIAARFVGTVVATVVVHVVLLLIVVGSTAVVVQSIQSESAALERYTEAQLDELGSDGGATFLTRTRLDERVGETVSSWGIGAVVGEEDASGIATRTSELILLVVFSAFFSLQGGALLTMVLGWTDDRDRRRVLREIWQESGERAAAFTRRAALVALVSGLGAGAVAVVFGLPAALLIGIGAGLLAVVPVLGVPVGWSPLVFIAIVDREPREAVAVAVASVLGVVAVAIFRGRVIDRGFSPGPVLLSVGLAAGLSAAGLPGAVCGMFLAVGVANALRHDWTVDRLTGLPRSHRPVAQPSQVVRTARSDPDGSGTTGDPIEPERRLLLKASPSTLVRTAAIVVLAFSLQLSLSRIGPTIVWATVGILIAVGLDRPVSWLERRWQVRRTVSVVAGALVVGAAVLGLALSASDSLGRSADIDTDLSELATSFEELPLVGDRLAEIDIEDRVADFEREVPRLLSSSTLAERVASLLGGGLVGGFWIFVVAASCLIDGPRVVAAINRRIPARLRRQAERLSRAGHGALSGYVAGSAAVAALNGIIVATMAFVAGVPAPAVLGIWAFSWNFVPQIGAIIGWAPFLLLAFLIGPLPGIVCLGLFVLYQLVENNLIQPAIVGHAVDISALAALSAALVGVAVAGLVGAVLAIPVAGVGRALFNEWRREDFPAIRTRPVVDPAT